MIYKGKAYSSYLHSQLEVLLSSLSFSTLLAHLAVGLDLRTQLKILQYQKALSLSTSLPQYDNLSLNNRARSTTLSYQYSMTNPTQVLLTFIYTLQYLTDRLRTKPRCQNPKYKNPRCLKPLVNLTLFFQASPACLSFLLTWCSKASNGGFSHFLSRPRSLSLVDLSSSISSSNIDFPHFTPSFMLFCSLRPSDSHGVSCDVRFFPFLPCSSLPSITQGQQLST
jgi:hypothetical protein